MPSSSDVGEARVIDSKSRKSDEGEWERARFRLGLEALPDRVGEDRRVFEPPVPGTPVAL